MRGVGGGVGGWNLSVNIAMPSFSLQRAKQANCSILPLMLPSPHHGEQAARVMIIDVAV